MSDVATPEAITFDMVDAYLRKPIEHELREAKVVDLVLGYVAAHARWVHKPYDRRNDEHREDYDRLRASIARDGIKSPLIVYMADGPVFGDPVMHVLIGMRRAEIAAEMDIETVPVAVILEDVRNWWNFDLERLHKLMTALGTTEY